MWRSGRVCFCLNVVCDGVSRGMLFYCARKVARAAATPISRLRIASLVPLIGEENFRSYKKMSWYFLFNMMLTIIFLNQLKLWLQLNLRSMGPL